MRFVIDVSTALQWIDRNAVGIVRTEREIAKHFLTTATNVEIIYFDRASQDFRKVKQEQINNLFPDITTNYLGKNNDALEFNSLFAFNENDVLISAGLQWDIDFLSAVYSKKKKQKIFLIQIIYDIIPIIMPEYCVDGMDVLFPKFIMDTVWTADIVYAISDSTRKDFIAYANKLQIGRVPPVHLIRLGCDMPESHQQIDGVDDLKPNEFVLYVSTIEPRKNHKMLFDIWRVFESSGKKNIPKLVFVGGKGWNMENFFSSLDNCSNLYPEKIVVLKDVSDLSLKWLYSNSLFTLYPSLYEGWGLPIAESLARGTPCISSNSSSMPEVAESFCDLIDPYDFVTWKNTIENYITEPHIVKEKRSHIKKSYNVKTWTNSMISFKADIEALSLQRANKI